jgi:acyl dehydratase
MAWKSVHWDEVKEGDELPTQKRDITRTTVIATAIATRDFTPVHHDHEAARKSGANDIFLNILTTGGLIGKYMTDWSGPEGQLKKMVIRLGATCYPGDTLTSNGKVVKKYTEAENHLIDIEYNLTVAMGPHAWGTVTMILPAKS